MAAVGAKSIAGVGRRATLWTKTGIPVGGGDGRCGSGRWRGAFLAALLAHPGNGCFNFYIYIHSIFV
jgi:hypothetical protein